MVIYKYEEHRRAVEETLGEVELVAQYVRTMNRGQIDRRIRSKVKGPYCLPMVREIQVVVGREVLAEAAAKWERGDGNAMRR